jgi:hypothetical protein
MRETRGTAPPKWPSQIEPRGLAVSAESNSSQWLIKGYNSGVNEPVPPKPASAGQHSENAPTDDEHHHRHAAYAAEATGLLLIAGLLLLLTIIRYWRDIPWSAR